jgi:hypothetical protein
MGMKSDLFLIELFFPFFEFDVLLWGFEGAVSLWDFLVEAIFFRLQTRGVDLGILGGQSGANHTKLGGHPHTRDK